MADEEVHAAHIKLPAFWSSDPELWFTQIEALFASRNFTADATKYGHLVAALPPETAVEVRDLLITPPAAGTRFETLKQEIIKRTTHSAQARIKQLLTAEELDGRKPTQLLRRMRQLIGSSGLIPADLLKQLFVQRLPTNVQVAVAGNDSLTVDQLADLADKIMEVITPQVSAVEPSEVAELRKEISELKSLLRSRPTDRNPPASRARSKTPAQAGPSTASEPQAVCWFHAKFGDKAKKCREPCSFRSGNGARSH